MGNKNVNALHVELRAAIAKQLGLNDNEKVVMDNFFLTGELGLKRNLEKLIEVVQAKNLLEYKNIPDLNTMFMHEFCVSNIPNEVSKKRMQHDLKVFSNLLKPYIGEAVKAQELRDQALNQALQGLKARALKVQVLQALKDQALQAEQARRDQYVASVINKLNDAVMVPHEQRRKILEKLGAILLLVTGAASGALVTLKPEISKKLIEGLAMVGVSAPIAAFAGPLSCAVLGLLATAILYKAAQHVSNQVSIARPRF